MHSFKFRYVVKVAARIISLLLGLVTASVVPRALGKISYGAYGFLEVFFNNLRSFLDVGTSTGYFNRLSRDQKNTKLIVFYYSFLALLLVISALILLGLVFLDLDRLVFPDIENPVYIFYGFVLMSLMFVSQVTTKTVDAFALTVKNEILSTVVKAVFVLVVGGLFFLNKLDLSTYYYSLFLQFSLLTLVGILIVARSHFVVFDRAFFRLDTASVKESTEFFWKYSHPLLVFSAFSFLAGTLDRWYLQRVAGSVDQSMFTLAFKVSQLAMLFVSSIVPLLQREYSIAFRDENRTRIAGLIKTYGNLMFVIAAYFTFFITANSGSVSVLLGGREFSDAGVPLMIMAFYPLHQSYGQVIGSFYFSTENTRKYRNIGMIGNILGLILTFVLITPKGSGGLGLGATGLALKMVVVQFVTVNVLIVFAFRYLNQSYLRNVFFQVRVSLVFLALSFGLKALQRIWFSDGTLAFVIVGAVYTLLALSIFLLAPSVIGIDPVIRDKLMGVFRIRNILNRLKGRREG